MLAKDVATILGLNPFESPFDVYLKLKYQVKLDTPEIQASRLLKPLIQKLFEEQHPYKVIQEETKSIGSIPIITNYTLLEPPAILITTASGLFSDTRHLWDSLPEYKKLEALLSLHAAKTDKGYVAALIGSQGFKSFEVTYEPQVVQDAISFAERWYLEYILGDKIPSVTVSQYIRYIPIEDRAVELDEDVIPIIEEYLRKQDEKGKLEEELEVLKNQIIMKMNLSSLAIVGDYEISYNLIERKGYYVKPTTIRRFKITKRK